MYSNTACYSVFFALAVGTKSMLFNRSIDAKKTAKTEAYSYSIAFGKSEMRLFCAENKLECSTEPK